MMLNALPLVTVVTPTYNRANYVQETIRSVLAQDYPNIEYIVLDDGSTDETAQILSSFSGRIAWETHPNMGEHRTVNKGLGMAKGDYVVVLNSDDLMLPGAITAAVNTFQANPDILAAYPGWYYIDATSKLLYEENVPEYDYSLMVQKHWCIPGPCSFISRKAFDLTELRDESFKYVADFEYWLRLGLFGKFKRIQGAYGTFRIHDSSASVNMKNKLMADEHIRLMRKYYRFDIVPEEFRKPPISGEAWGRAYLHAARTCTKNSIEAWFYYLCAIIYWPSLSKVVFSEAFPKMARG